MSASEKTQESASYAQPIGGPVSGTRVDPAHVRADELPEPQIVAPDALAPEAVDQAHMVDAPSADVMEQVRLQAAQLAAHLQRQAASVDHRESELNARLAAMESQVRAARMWLTEQQSDLDARAAEVARRERELEERETRLAEHAVPDRPRSRGSAAANPTHADQREAELDRRQHEIDALAERMADQLAAAREVEAARNAAHGLDARAADLDRAEQLLTLAQADLERQRSALAEEHERQELETQSQREALELLQQQFAVEHDQARRELKRQGEELAARQAVLEQMRVDISRSQQETLEIRLATEELWARLQGAMAPAALTQSLAKIRSELAEQHRLTRTELAQQKMEIQALSARLAEQHHKLAQRRDQLQAWAELRERDLAQQAARLAQQEQRLHSEFDSLAEARAEWDGERFRLEQEIRRLLRERHRANTAAA